MVRRRVPLLQVLPSLSLWQLLRGVGLLLLFAGSLLTLRQSLHLQQQARMLRTLTQEVTQQRDEARTLVETWRDIAIAARERCGPREPPL